MVPIITYTYIYIYTHVNNSWVGLEPTDWAAVVFPLGHLDGCSPAEILHVGRSTVKLPDPAMSLEVLKIHLSGATPPTVSDSMFRGNSNCPASRPKVFVM